MEDQINTKPQDKNQIGQNINNQSYPTSQKSKANFSILLVVIICFIIFGFGGYYLGKQFNKSIDDINTPNKQAINSSVSKTPTTTDTVLNSGISPTLNQVTKETTPTLKSFTTKDEKYTINYPEGWVLTDQSKLVDLYGDGKTQLQYNISISKDSHIIQSYYPIAWGPSACFYPDFPKSGIPDDFSAYSEIKDFVELTNSKNTYRRPKIGQNTTLNQKKILRWDFCSKNVHNFNSVVGFGSLWYETPVNYNPEIIKEMDQITITFPRIY